VQVDIRAVAFHADELEVAAEVTRVQAGDGETISEACHGRLEVRLVEIRVQIGRLVDGGVHVSPYQWDAAAGDSSALVADFDGDVFATFAHDDLCHREFLLVRAVRLDNSSQAVLEGLEQHVRQMSWYVHEVEVRRANQADLGRIEQAVVILANETSVLDGFLRQVPHVGICANYSDIVRVCMCSLVGQSDVLSNEHAYSDTAHVKSIQESLNVVVYLHALSFPFVFQNALCDCGHDWVVSPLDLLKCASKFVVVIGQLGRPLSVVLCGASVVLS
jgi:hypothetical protein